MQGVKNEERIVTPRQQVPGSQQKSFQQTCLACMCFSEEKSETRTSSQGRRPAWKLNRPYPSGARA